MKELQVAHHRVTVNGLKMHYVEAGTGPLSAAICPMKSGSKS